MNPAHKQWTLIHDGMTHRERARFYAKIGPEDEGGCWPWLAAPANKYGQFWVQRQRPVAHRVSYQLFIGPIPDGLELDHLCRNTMCVNPSHLEPVDTRENQRRGIGFVATNIVKTHCLYGHLFDEKNTRLLSGGRKRQCKQCRKETALRTYYRNRDHILFQRRERRSRGLAN